MNADATNRSRLRPLSARALARIAVWSLGVATTVAGLILLLQRTIVLWEPVPELADTWEATPIDATGTGLTLLCTGILVLALTLMAEAYLPAPGAFSTDPEPEGKDDAH